MCSALFVLGVFIVRRIFTFSKLNSGHFFIGLKRITLLLELTVLLIDTFDISETPLDASDIL